MSYKTILVHSGDERRWPRLLGVSLDLSRRFEAHLTALSVMPPVIIDPALTPGGIVTIIESHRQAYQKERSRMRAYFEDQARAAGVSAEWRNEDAERGTVAEKVIDHGRSADLIIAMQTDPEWSYSHLMEAPAELVLQTGRPVLFVPNVGEHVGCGSRVLIAWNGRRESARAAFDALPILKQAEKVSVLWINAGEDSAAQQVPAADLCTALARHGVACEAATIDRPDQPDGETLLARVRYTHANLLVMGCYGHSRLREFILGGVTRQVLKEMSVPVLMAH